MKKENYEFDPNLGFAGKGKEVENNKEVKPHIPLQLKLQEQYKKPQRIDERNFLYYGKPISNYEKEIAKMYLLSRGQKGINTFHMDQESTGNRRLVRELATSLGRVPTPAEVSCEYDRRAVFKQVEQDYFYGDPTGINQNEIFPQQKVINNRKDDFPEPEKALDAFRDGDVRIEEKDGIKRLIIAVPNKEGKIIEHPVMTNEEIHWVVDSAKAIKQSLEGKESKKVFIGGLGLGLLNRELSKLGINDQVVAELNPKVINLISEELKTEHPEIKLNARQGDFKIVLQEAIKNGEQFDAISIDAFPNTAEEVNNDASNNQVFELAYKALKPGGMITFYPDSRYLPLRVLNTLHKMNVPESSIHYIVSEFKTSEFTKSYYHDKLMSVPMIQKPLLDDKNLADNKMIDDFINKYYEDLDKKAEEYVDKFINKDKLPEQKLMEAA